MRHTRAGMMPVDGDNREAEQGRDGMRIEAVDMPEEIDIATTRRHRADDGRDRILQLAHDGPVRPRVVDGRLLHGERRIDDAPALESQLARTMLHRAVEIVRQPVAHDPSLAGSPQVQEHVLHQLLSVLDRQSANAAGESHQGRPVRPVDRFERPAVAPANGGDELVVGTCQIWLVHDA
jgi:hypothetical protein